MGREEMFKGDIGQGLVTRRESVRRSIDVDPHLIDSPTYERLTSWGKVVRQVDAHYHNLYLTRPDKKRKFFKVAKRDVYLVALLNVPLYSEDVRLPTWPLTTEIVRRIVVNIHEAYKETAGLIQAQADFPTYSSATIEMRWLTQEFSGWLNKLANEECTLEDVLEMIEKALDFAKG